MDCCAILNCTEPPTYKYLCSKSENNYCERHAEQHVIIDGNHELVINYFKISMAKSNMISLQCRGCISKAKVTYDKMLKILNENIQMITKVAMDFIEENRKREKLYIDVLNYLAVNQKIIKKSSYEPVEEFILENMKTPNEILNSFNKSEPQVLERVDLSKRLSNSNSEITRKSIINNELSELNNKHALLLQYWNIEINEEIIEEAYNDLLIGYQSRYMCFFKDGEKNLNIVDVISREDNKTEIQISDVLGRYMDFVNFLIINVFTIQIAIIKSQVFAIFLILTAKLRLHKKIIKTN